MKDNQYLMISTRVYYETFALIMTKACMCRKSFLDKRKFREQVDFFFIEKKKIYLFYKKTCAIISHVRRFIVLLNVLEEILYQSYGQ